MNAVPMGPISILIVEILRRLGEMVWKNREELAKTGLKLKKFRDDQSVARKSATGNLEARVKLLEDGLLQQNDIVAEVTGQLEAVQEGLETAVRELDVASKRLVATMEQQAKEIALAIAAAKRKARVAAYVAWVSSGVAVVALAVAIIR